MIRSGRLDKRITIQRKTTTPNDYGELIETWVDLATVWAIYLPARGSERFAAQQQIAEIDTVFRIRYRQGVTAMDRIVYNGRTYDIKAVVDMCGRKDGIELYAKARAE